MTQLTILTGASRGLGLALAKRLLAPQHTLLCISRHSNVALTEQAFNEGGALIQWTEDLAQGAWVSQRLEQWLSEQMSVNFSSVTLINNASAVLTAPLSQVNPDDLARTLRVGLEAPMQLTAVFLRVTATWRAQRKVLNISSGLARSAMASQAAYCAVKAAMDHFTRCVALEEAIKPNGAQICALAPGVIDTDMQVQLRSADPSVFPDQESFSRLKSSGQLASPDFTASRVLTYLRRADFGAQAVADIRD